MSRILVIEDDQFLRNAYHTFLNKENFDVKIAENGAVGLRIAQKWHPHLIMLDLLMPEMDGIEFLKQFDAKNHLETKIIVFSNLSSPEKINEAMALGAVNYKVKAKFAPREMISLIQETIDAKAVAPSPTASDTATA